MDNGERHCPADGFTDVVDAVGMILRRGKLLWDPAPWVKANRAASRSANMRLLRIRVIRVSERRYSLFGKEVGRWNPPRFGARDACGPNGRSYESPLFHTL